jgi:hypothetical protein
MCYFAHQKFGFRVYIDYKVSKKEAKQLYKEILSIIKRGIQAIAPEVKKAGKEALEKGDIIIENRLYSAESRYLYFSKAAKKHKNSSARQYLEEAAVISFFSLIEHLCVLLLAFSKSKHKNNLHAYSRQKWHYKYKVVFPLNIKIFSGFYTYMCGLATVKRNPNSHGYLGKYNEIFDFYLEPARHRIPMSLYDLELLSKYKSSKTNLAKLDTFLKTIRKHKSTEKAMLYLDAHLDLSYSPHALKEYEGIQKMTKKRVLEYVEYMSRQADDFANMDW